MFALVAGTLTTTLFRGFFWLFWDLTLFIVRGGSTPYIVVALQLWLWLQLSGHARSGLQSRCTPALRFSR